MNGKNRRLITIISPAYNEEQNVPLIYDAIQKEFASPELSKYSWEIIFVNDGSRDASWQAISQLASQRSNVKGLSLSRNFSHPNALQAGLEHANGSAVIMMDCDLQHPPSLIKDLVYQWENGYDIVNTLRQSTEGEGLIKRITSSLYYKILNSLSSLELEEGQADFRLLDRRVVQVINSLPEKPKFYRGIVNWIGFKKYQIVYKAAARQHGRSSFTVRKMLELARIGLTSFSMRPLKTIIVFGALVTICSLLGVLWALYLKIFIGYDAVANVTIISLALMFGIGLILIGQGIIALYIVDIYMAAKDRPSYIIAEKVGFERDGEK